MTDIMFLIFLGTFRGIFEQFNMKQTVYEHLSGFLVNSVKSKILVFYLFLLRKIYTSLDF